MKKQIINTDAAPAAIGPYSRAVKIGDLVFFSGQIGLDPKTMTLADNVTAQAEQIFKNIQALTEACHATFDNIVKLTIFLTDMENFAAVNEVMARLFKEPYPARSTVAVRGLPKNALVEVEAIVAVD